MSDRKHGVQLTVLVTGANGELYKLYETTRKPPCDPLLTREAASRV